jgi:hypothetical protein
MATSFASMKKNKQSDLDKLSGELSRLQSNQNNMGDDRFWKPEVDKSGNGYAIVRFLPSPMGEDVPFVRLWDHGFQGPGGWFIEKSLTTLGKDDPVSEYNTMLWNSGVDKNKDLARKQKRRLGFISNIYIVKDPANPANEGKVFLYKYGKKIFDKLNDVMNPEFEDETPTNPFDMWEGRDFKMKIRNVEGYRNYDKSDFAEAAPLLDDDKQLEEIWKSQHSLSEFIDEKNFKSYAELKNRLYRVLMLDNAAPSVAAEPDPEPETSTVVPMTSSSASVDEDDEDLSFFKKLADED